MCTQYEVCYGNFTLVSYRIRSDTFYKLVHHRAYQSLDSAGQPTRKETMIKGWVNKMVYDSWARMCVCSHCPLPNDKSEAETGTPIRELDIPLAEESSLKVRADTRVRAAAKALRQQLVTTSIGPTVTLHISEEYLSYPILTSTHGEASYPVWLWTHGEGGKHISLTQLHITSYYNNNKAFCIISISV